MLGASRLSFLAKTSVAAGRTALTASAVNNTQIDTAQSKFGGASALFDGVDDALDITHNGVLDVGSNNYTVEAFFRRTAGGDAFNHIYVNNWYYASTRSHVLTVDTSAAIVKFFFTQNGSTDVTLTGTTTISTGTWYHVAVSFDGSTVRLFVDGNLEDSASATQIYDASTTIVRLGANASAISGGNFSGHIDELRVSNTARYTSGFTAPTSAFTNDANTLLLMHMDGSDGSTTFTDDNS